MHGKITKILRLYSHGMGIKSCGYSLGARCLCVYGKYVTKITNMRLLYFHLFFSVIFAKLYMFLCKYLKIKYLYDV